jgi:iron-sulfur cluster assembly accessory protein
VDRTADLGSEDIVDEPVLLDPRQSVEAVRHDLGAEVVPAACQILDLGAGAWERRLDAVLELLRGRHRESRITLDLPTKIWNVVTLTDVAAQKIGTLLSDEEHASAGLRVAVRGGGCSGFQYQLALDEQRDGDQIFEHDGIRIIVDELSLRYVDGSTVDYTESLMGAGFQVENPNVVAACGCGSSFRVADEDPSCGAPA